MSTHLAVHVPSAGAAFELAQVETSPPERDHVRIDVATCGVCGTDAAFVNGAFPGLSWPLTPGHEIAGTIAEVGAGSPSTPWVTASPSAGSAGTAPSAPSATVAISSTARTARSPAGTTPAGTPNQ